MDWAVCLVPTQIDVPESAEYPGESGATDLSETLLSVLVSEVSGEPWDLYVLDPTNGQTSVDLEALPGTEAEFDVVDESRATTLPERYERTAFLATNTLTDAATVQTALQALKEEGQSTVVTPAVRNGWTVLAVTNRRLPGTAQSLSETLTVGPSESVPPDTDGADGAVRRFPSDGAVRSVEDLPMLYTQSFRSEVFEPVRSLVEPYNRPVSIAVVNTTYKRPDETIEMIDSVRESLSHYRQSFPDTDLDFEFRVCIPTEDDVSIERLEAINWDPLTVMAIDAVSKTENRDAGFRATEQDYVVSVDSDCIVELDWIASIYRSIKKHRFPGAIQGAYYHDYEPERTWFTNCESLADENRWNSGQADSRNLILRRETYLEIGAYTTEFFYSAAAEDLVLRKRIEDAGREFVMDDSIRLAHKYPQTMIANLKRYHYWGKGCIHVKRYEPELYWEQYSPWQNWRRLATLEVGRERIGIYDQVPPSVFVYLVLKVIVYTVGFVQGVVIYQWERLQNTELLSTRMST